MTWAGGGNVNPIAALGVRLLERGHRVRTLGPPELAWRFEAEGIALRRFTAPAGMGRHDDVIDEAARQPTDVIVVDYMQPQALCGAERTGLPFAALVHTLYAAQAVGPMSPMAVFTSPDAVNAVRQELDLAPVERVTDLLDQADRVLVTTTRDFDRPAGQVPANVRYVGPIVPEAGPDANWTPPWPPSDTPMVVLSLSTLDMGEAPVMQRVLDALADLRVHVFATVGDHLEPEAFHWPSNAVVSRHVRHAAVLPHARLIVTHAGFSTVGAALSFGLPMICIPLGHEQPDNAAHVEAAGAGRALTREAEVEDIRAAVADVLGDRAYHEAAQRMAESIRPLGNGAVAVDELEQLL